MTAKDVRRNIEVRLAYGVDLVHTRCCDWFYAVDRTGNVLRVIEGVIEIRAELDLLAAFTNAKVLEDRQVYILNRLQLQCIPASVCQCTQPGLNVLSSWRVRQIRNDSRGIRRCAGAIRIKGRTSSQ